MLFDSFYSGKRILVTGHTGFKGAWLCQWLLSLGAQVYGYALDPRPHERLFTQLELAHRLASDTRGDLKDFTRLTALVKDVQPDAVLHLAAQPLVRLSYEIPVATFETNVMGTIRVLEALRALDRPCAAVMITTDKCYENREWIHGYREEDAMGGYDPYSASKGCAELAIAAWRRSFFANHPVRIASARAGNVIGGGDWALDRIVPDCIRALREGRAIPVRNKTATRPWQHVLEPLSGYLALGAALLSPEALKTPPQLSLTSGFNFGPSLASNRTVADLVETLLKHLPGTWEDLSSFRGRRGEGTFVAFTEGGCKRRSEYANDSGRTNPRFCAGRIRCRAVAGGRLFGLSRSISPRQKPRHRQALFCTRIRGVLVEGIRGQGRITIRGTTLSSRRGNEIRPEGLNTLRTP